MLRNESLKFLEELLISSGPSGFEYKTADLFRKYLGGFADRVYADVMGNSVGVINEKSDFRIMLAGHYDEIGFQIMFISEDGYLYFRNIGGIDRYTVPGSEVEVLTSRGRVRGVIGKKPIHLMKDSGKDVAPELKEMWIDIGAESRKDAEKIVSVGDPVAIKSNYCRLGSNRIVSKGLDDKIGAFVVAEVLRELSARKLNCSVYAVGTVQEELGLRGATASAFGIHPKVAFAVDLTFSSDVPDVDKKSYGDIRLGAGPAVCRNADNNIVLLRKMKEAAKRKKIKFQEKIGYKASGGTDTAAIQLSRGGVATALISVPNRYMHTPVEVCDLRDIEGAIKLIAETILTLRPGDSFVPDSF